MISTTDNRQSVDENAANSISKIPFSAEIESKVGKKSITILESKKKGLIRGTLWA